MIAFDAKLRAEMSFFFLFFFPSKEHAMASEGEKNTVCGSDIQSNCIFFPP